MNQDIGSIISLIMERPELVAEIKALAESGRSAEPDEDTKVTPEVVAAPQRSEEAVAAPIQRTKSRSELVRALSPFISKERQKAIETFLTIADILETMRAK
ncbi:MAG: hypothetical protein J6Q69_04465 [Clostridia bacterium]|nr:hypothetical protein [Clostridia bacterium]